MINFFINNIIEMFLDHPRTNCMSYLEHAKFSAYLSFLLFESSLKAIIHSIFPFYYKTSTSDTCNIIKNLIETNGCSAKDN